MANNKIVYNGTTLIDLTSDDVKNSDVRSGVIFHLPDGTQSEGTLEVGDDMKVIFFETDPEETLNAAGDMILVNDMYDENGDSVNVDDVLSNMPKVLAVWVQTSDSYYVFNPFYYATYTNYPNLDFRCDNNSIFRLHYNNTSFLWELYLDSVVGSAQYEEWTFEVDDGAGGTTTIVKAVNCVDITP